MALDVKGQDLVKYESLTEDTWEALMIDWYDLSLYKLSSDTYLGWWGKADTCQVKVKQLFQEEWTKFLSGKLTEAKQLFLTTKSQTNRF